MIPRTIPRREQYIRASRAQELGLVQVLVDEGVRDPRIMAQALRRLPTQPLPSSVVVPGLLDGRKNVVELAREWLHERHRTYPARASVTVAGGRGGK